ncbi:MAG: sugar phosphate isomerase/epimerase [Bacteroidales bacterium]|jgi:sugar phosphate isomerase/epimerase|nr:sugar phosphate isomerase/epimerase [Bacteroidales bacterium]
MDRRNFLQKGTMAVLAGCGMSAIPANAFAAATAKKGNRIGIQLYSIRESLPKDFQGSVKKLADIGYHYAEAYGWDGKSFMGKSLKETAAILADVGMQLSGTHCGTGLLPTDINNKEWDYWRTSAQEMHAAGGRHLVQSWLPVEKTLDNLKRLAAQFNKIGEICKQGGVKFGYHNHHAEFQQIEGNAILDVLIQNTNPALVFFQMDLGHTVNGGGDVLGYMRKYPKRFLSWHASDFKRGGDYTEVGSGDVPWMELFNIAKSYGLEDLTVEQETGADIYASCKTDFDYLAQFAWTKVKR